MQKTAIEWVKNPDGSQGYTFNPLTGCLNNCPYCYARKLANTRLKERYLANEDGLAPLRPISSIYQGYPNLDPFYPRFWEDRLWDLPAQGKSKGIFVCDMSDLFGIGIPEEWTNEILSRIRNEDNNRFYLLTKQPQNLQKFSPYPPNVWLGVSVTNKEMFDKAVHCLKMVDAKVKFLSFEPLLDHIAIDKF